MPDLLVKDGLIVTMDGKHTVIKSGSIVVENEKIVQIGRDVGVSKAEEVIDASGKIVLPGFVCAHTHFSRILTRGNPQSPENIFKLRNLWQKADEVLSRDELETCLIASCLEHLRSGATFVAGILSGSNLPAGISSRILFKVQEVGVRMGISVQADESRGRLKGAHGMRENEKLIKKIRRMRLRGVLGFASVRLSPTTSEELLKYGKEISQKYRAPLLLHADGGRWMREVCYQVYGEGLLSRLAELGLLKQSSILIHHLPQTEQELSLLKNSGAKLGYTISDVGEATYFDRLLGERLPMGLGDDGAMSDVFELMRAVYLLQNLVQGGGQLKPLDLLEMATVRGAEIYGLNAGALESGRMADILLLNPSRLPTPVGPSNVISQLIENFDRSLVDTVIVGGRVVMREGKILSVDEEKVLEECRKVAERVWDRVEGSF